MKIAFIGLGNMATAMLKGILQAGIAAPSDITGVCHTEKTAARMCTEYGIYASTEITEAVFKADVLFLAVKPAVLSTVANEIAGRGKDSQIIVSVAAGKSVAWLEEHFGEDRKIIRSMPNTPALVGEACTGITPNENVTDAELSEIVSIFESFGKAYVVKESMMDAVCAAGGSAPAFVFMFIESIADAAVKNGMPRQTALEFAAQTVYGSAKLVLDTKRHPGELKDMVCSPGGTTIEGVNVLEEKGFRGTVMAAVNSAAEKSAKL